MPKTTATGSFIELKMSQEGEGQLHFGYDFKPNRNYPQFLTFKSWNRQEGCENSKHCYVAKDAVKLGATDARCGTHEVKLLLPQRNATIFCRKEGELTEEDFNELGIK